MPKQLEISFETGEIIEHEKENNLRDWCISNNKKYILEEWDYEKNSILPTEITSSYNNKIWWICSKGHKWQATVIARTRKKATGCPYCKGSLPIEGVNDFETSNPELMLDWDFNKNVGINPKKLTANTGTYIDWKCHFCGYEWRSRANNRSSNKRGCPNCSMKSTSFGEQATYYYVKKIFPNAINRYREGRFELDILIPNINLAIEFDGVFFHKGKENDIREKNKFKKCQEKGITLIRIKDSKVLGMDINADDAIFVNKLKSNDGLNKAINSLLLKLKSSNYILVEVDDFKVDVEKDYFKILSDKYIREEKNSFVNIKPDLLDDWDYELNEQVNPKALTPSCSFYVNWKCHICGYKWKARIPDRLRGDGCPCCNRNVLVEGVNDFSTLYPNELLEWDYDKNTIAPNKVTSYQTKVIWKCSKCGHNWVTTINDKVIRKDKTGCPKCAKRLIALKRHQRAMKNGAIFERFPELLNYWDFEKNNGIDINDIAAGSPTRYWWKCPDCGYEWEASPNNKTRGGKIGGCPKCSRKKK